MCIFDVIIRQVQYLHTHILAHSIRYLIKTCSIKLTQVDNKLFQNAWICWQSFWYGCPWMYTYLDCCNMKMRKHWTNVFLFSHFAHVGSNSYHDAVCVHGVLADFLAYLFFFPCRFVKSKISFLYVINIDLISQQLNFLYHCNFSKDDTSYFWINFLSR